MFKRIQITKNSFTEPNDPDQFSVSKNGFRSKASCNTGETFQKTPQKRIKSKLQSIREREDENQDERVSSSPTSRKRVGQRLTESSIHSYQGLANKSNSKVIDQRTSALKTKLEDKLFEAQQKM